MNNLIFDIDDNISNLKINLTKPVLINNNTYFSKITHGDNDKNLYIKLNKCYIKNTSKNTLTKNKYSSELLFSINNEKNTLAFFENLENFIIENNIKLGFENVQEL